MTSQSSEVLTTDVHDPTGIAWYYNETDGTSRFYVGQDNYGNVKIFEESWAVVSTIENFSLVTAIIISPVKTLWVADHFAGKIDEFDLHGNFIRNVLSGLTQVQSMSYHPAHASYLWVTFLDVTGQVTAQRIKIY